MEAVSINEKLLIDRFQFYNVFFHYYTNRLWDKSVWEAYVIPTLYGQLKDRSNNQVLEGVNLLKGLEKEDIVEAKYDFNRLFIGPSMLLAPPYESVYQLNLEGFFEVMVLRQ